MHGLLLLWLAAEVHHRSRHVAVHPHVRGASSALKTSWTGSGVVRGVIQRQDGVSGALGPLLLLLLVRLLCGRGRAGGVEGFRGIGRSTIGDRGSWMIGGNCVGDGGSEAQEVRFLCIAKTIGGESCSVSSMVSGIRVAESTEFIGCVCGGGDRGSCLSHWSG